MILEYIIEKVVTGSLISESSMNNFLPEAINEVYLRPDLRFFFQSI